MKKKKSSFFFVLVSLVALVAIALVFTGGGKKKKSTATPHSALNGDTPKSRIDYAKINRHMQELGAKMYFDRAKVKIDNVRLAPPAGSVVPRELQIDPRTDGLRFNQENKDQAVAESLGKNTQGDSTYLTPEDEIQMEMQQRYEDQQYQEIYKEQYVKQFIENARRDGYKIKVDKNMNVTEIVPIKNGPRDPSSVDNNKESLPPSEKANLSGSQLPQ